MDDKKILYATDYSQVSADALPTAETLARETGATLLIAHVSESELYPVGELFDENPPPNPAEIDELNAVVPADPRIKCEHRLLFGEPGSVVRVNPADAILKLAKEEHPLAIVVGSHGRSRLARMLMGSVAEAIVRGAPCPVIAIKQPDEK